MRYCFQSPYHITCISCKYPPLINQRFKEADFHSKIINIVCVHFGILTYQISSVTKKREIVDARHIAMYLIDIYIPKMTLKSNGRLFKRDHTTVISAKKKCNDLIKTDSKFNNNISELRAKIDSYIQRTTI